MRKYSNYESGQKILEWILTKSPYRHFANFTDIVWKHLSCGYACFDKSPTAIEDELKRDLERLEKMGSDRVVEECEKYIPNCDTTINNVLNKFFKTKTGKSRVDFPSLYRYLRLTIFEDSAITRRIIEKISNKDIVSSSSVRSIYDSVCKISSDYGERSPDFGSFYDRMKLFEKNGELISKISKLYLKVDDCTLESIEKYIDKEIQDEEVRKKKKIGH